MSQSYCRNIWGSSAQELEELLRERQLVAQNNDTASTLYVRHLQHFKKLNDIYALNRQPQERELLQRGLALCAGLVISAWDDLVTANKGTDVIDLQEVLLNLNLTPDDLEIPVPGALKEARAAQLALHFKAVAAAAAAPVRSEAGNGDASLQLITSKPVGMHTRHLTAPGPAASCRHFETNEAAAAAIQAAWRSYRDRKRVSEMRSSEALLLGMNGKHSMDDLGDLVIARTDNESLEAKVAAQRKRRQDELDVAFNQAHARILVEEGPFLLLEERVESFQWMQHGLDSATGRLPQPPLQGPLGSPIDAAAAQAPPPSSPPVSRTSPATSKSKVKPSASSGSPVASLPSTAVSATSPPRSHTEALNDEMLRVVGEWKAQWDAAAAHQNAKSTNSENEDTMEELRGLPLPRRGSSVDALDVELLQTTVRDGVREKARDAARGEARAAAEAANARLPKVQPLVADGKRIKGKKPAPQPASKKPAAKQLGGATAVAAAPKDPLHGHDQASIIAELASQGIARMVDCVQLAQFLGEDFLLSRESLPSDSVEAPPTPVKKVRSGGKAANVAAVAAQAVEAALPYPELSLAQARQSVTLHCALPLAAHIPVPSLYLRGAPSAAPPAQMHTAVLLYGPAGCGKSMLTMAVAHEVGAAFFDLSPATLAGKYPGKQIDDAVRMVFQAAKAAAPAVIYIDEVEKVFIQDKTRAAALAQLDGEPSCRIRRQLMEEAALLKPGDGVLIVGNSRQPQACVGSDEVDFVSFFQVMIRLPLPDDRSRGRLLASFAAAQGVGWGTDRWPEWHALSLAAHLTGGYTAGQLESLVEEAAVELKAARATAPAPGGILPCTLLDFLLEACSKELPLQAADNTAITEWTARAQAMRMQKARLPLVPETGAKKNTQGKTVAQGKSSPASSRA